MSNYVLSGVKIELFRLVDTMVIVYFQSLVLDTPGNIVVAFLRQVYFD